MSNEQILKDFIAEVETQTLTVEWVNWMLDLLERTNRNNVMINPEWLRARPAITAGVKDNEPQMVDT